MAASEEKEGTNLLGAPTFKKLENGRFKCVQTGHEVLDKDKETYSNSKRCRLGLIDFALSRNKPPLNMFKPDPLSRSKLICKLTGDTVNKSEEHIWKHINGKRFLNKLEEMETQELTPEAMVELNEKKVEKQCEDDDDKNDVKKKKKKKKKKDKKKKKKNNKDSETKPVEEIISEIRESNCDESDSEERDFWMPPKGERWDFDNGGDRWGSDSESDDGDGDDNETVAEVEEDGKESEELSVRTKRMSIEIGPSSFASRKKKPKKNGDGCSLGNE